MPAGGYEYFVPARDVALWAPPWPDNGFTQRNWDNETAVPRGGGWNPPELDLEYHRRDWFPGDVDGDGRMDYISVTEYKVERLRDSPYFLSLHTAMANRNGTRVLNAPGTGRDNYRYAGQSTGADVLTAISWSHSPRNWFRAFAGDVNADGLTDVIIVRLQDQPRTPNQPPAMGVWVHTFLSRGDGRFERPPPQRLGDHVRDWDRSRWFVADANGDARSDLLLAEHGAECTATVAALAGCKVGSRFDHPDLRVGLSNGDGSWSFSPVQETGWTFEEADDAHWFAGDANGDGRADFQRVVNHEPHGPIATNHAAIQTALSKPRSTATPEWVDRVLSGVAARMKE